MIHTIDSYEDFDVSRDLKFATPSLNDYILLLGYSIFFFSMYAFNTNTVPDYIFIYLVAPLALLPIDLSWSKQSSIFSGIRVSIGSINLTKTLLFSKSWFFILVLFYMTIISFSSFMIPEPSAGWFKIMFLYFLIPNLLYILITARLSIVFQDASSLFYTVITSIASLNALYNIYIFILQGDILAHIQNRDFIPQYGIATGFGVASCALTYMLMLLCCISTIPVTRSRIEKFLLAVSAIILSSALLLTQSRAPLIGLFFGLLPIVYLAIKSFTKKQRFIFVIFCGAVFFLPFIISSPFARKDTYRFEVWRKFSQLILDRPIFGFGERLNIDVILSYGERIHHAHNIIYTSLLRGGIIAALLMCVIYLFSFFETLKSFLNHNYIAPLSLLLSLASSSMVDYELMVYSSGWHWASLWFAISLWAGSTTLNKYSKY